LPTNWYWFIDASGKLYLKEKSTSATHKFILRKHIKELKTHKNIETVINRFFIWSGVGSVCLNYVDSTYSDATSITDYGTIADLKIDSDVHTTAYANLLGNPKIAENKDVKRRITIVVGSDYDLASIKPGDTCKVMDINEAQTLFGTNMSIVRISYKVDEALIELTEFDANLSDLTQEQEDVVQSAIDQLQRSLQSISPDNLTLGSKDWVTDLAFSSIDHNTVGWEAGSIKAATSSASSPLIYSIAKDDTGNMGATTVIYFDADASTNSLQTSTSFSDAMGPNKIGLCYAIPAIAPKGASVVNVKPGLGMVIDGANIAVRTVLAEQIAANVITANEIYGNTITGNQLAAIDVSQISTASLPADGILIHGTGIYGRKASVTTFSINTSGDVVVSGNITVTAGNALKYDSGIKQADGTGSTADDILADGSTYKRLTANQQTGAGRAYTGLDASSIITKGFLEANLTSISLPANGIRFDSNGIYGRKSSATTFYISSAGDAYFKGTIAASTITGGTITGSVVSSAASNNNRIEMCNSSFGESSTIYWVNSSNVAEAYIEWGFSGVMLISGATLRLLATTVECDADFIPYGSDYDLGTNSNRWRYLYATEICLSGDCKTSWPSGGVFTCSDLSTCSLSELGTKSHSDLTSVTASQHHSSVSNGLNITPSSVSTAGVLSGNHLNINCSDAGNKISGNLAITGTVDGVDISAHDGGAITTYHSGTINDAMHGTRTGIPNAHHSSTSDGINITPLSVYLTDGTHKIYGPYTSMIFETSGSSSGGISITPGSSGLTITAGAKLIAGSSSYYLNINQKSYGAHYACGFDHIGDIMPESAGIWDLGSSSNYFNDLNYKNLQDRGCLGVFDDGVELQDGRKVSDVDALKNIKKHPSFKTSYGVPRFDYRTMPKAVYSIATDRNGKPLPRDKNDIPYKIDKKTKKKIKAEDGAELSALVSIMIGAIKELEIRLLKVEKS